MFFKTTIKLLTGLSILSATSFANTTQALKKIDNSNISKQNNVREGTILYKLKDNVHPKYLKKLNALINKTNLLSKKDIKGLQISIAKIKGINGKEQSFAKKLFDTGAVLYAEADITAPISNSFLAKLCSLPLIPLIFAMLIFKPLISFLDNKFVLFIKAFNLFKSFG